MRLLGIETSSERLSLAILKNKRILIEYNGFRNRNSSSLIKLLRNILDKTNLSWQDLDALCVGIGPGSFTGLRVGIATAKGLALGLKKPLVGINCLDTIAMNVRNSPLNICVVVDARKNLVYSSVYRFLKGKLRRISNYSLVSFEVLVKNITSPLIFVGDGLKRYAFYLKDREDCYIYPTKYWFPKASNLLLLARELFERKKFSAPERLTPLYLHKKECQIT
jgi:tRNA threonylcarbamoyl adenosine modification protein YeaZ